MMRTHGARRLAAAFILVTLLWGGVFPRLMRWGPLARHIELMDRREVNVAAMYYTELERLPLRPLWFEQRVLLWPDGRAGMASSSGRE